MKHITRAGFGLLLDLGSSCSRLATYNTPGIFVPVLVLFPRNIIVSPNSGIQLTHFNGPTLRVLTQYSTGPRNKYPLSGSRPEHLKRTRPAVWTFPSLLTATAVSNHRVPAIAVPRTLWRRCRLYLQLPGWTLDVCWVTVSTPMLPICFNLIARRPGGGLPRCRKPRVRGAGLPASCLRRM